MQLQNMAVESQDLLTRSLASLPLTTGLGKMHGDGACVLEQRVGFCKLSEAPRSGQCAKCLQPFDFIVVDFFLQHSIGVVDPPHHLYQPNFLNQT